jgi:ADP-heptose:LPS heptosyltransferase
LTTEPRILIGPPGDLEVCIQSLALLDTLRQQFPRAVTHWVVEEEYAPLVAAHTALDGVIRLPRKWHQRWGLAPSVWRQLRQTSSVLALDPRSSTRSAWVLWLSRVPERWGWSAPRGRGGSVWLNNHRIPTASEVPRTIARMLDELITAPLPPHIHVPRNTAAEAAADEWILAAQLLCGFVVICVGADDGPGTAWARACGRLARQLGQRRGLTTVVTGELATRTWQECIAACAGGHALLAPPLDLSQSAALIRRAQLSIARDSGWLQLSAALGCPTVGLRSAPNDDVRLLFGEQLLWFDSHHDENGVGRLSAEETWRDLPSESLFLACTGLLDRHSAASTRVA